MKNRLAALLAAAVLVSTAPASATESSFLLRGVEMTAPATTGVPATATPQPTDAAPVRKVRVVLGSPYGN